MTFPHPHDIVQDCVLDQTHASHHPEGDGVSHVRVCVPTPPHDALQGHQSDHPPLIGADILAPKSQRSSQLNPVMLLIGSLRNIVLSVNTVVAHHTDCDAEVIFV
jgi:hypothetical protein